MVKNLCLACALVLALSASVLAADLDGRWSWSEAGRRGNSFTVVLTLKVNGAKLTGTITTPGGGGPGRRGGGGGGGDNAAPNEIKISNGKVNGNEFSFKVNQQQGRGGMSITIEYKGTLNEDNLELEITRPGMGPNASPTVTKVTAERSLT
jgi:opacity protein-like surface antigen